MPTRHFLIELRHSSDIETARGNRRTPAQAKKPRPDPSDPQGAKVIAVLGTPGLGLDLGDFAPDDEFVARVGRRRTRRQRFEHSPPSESTYFIRGKIEDANQADFDTAVDTFRTNAAAADEVVEVFADLPLGSSAEGMGPVCDANIARGVATDVERLLCLEQLRAAGMDGQRVLLAIVDTGVDLAELERLLGQEPALDVDLSWHPEDGPGTGGGAAIGHGTMCAYDALLAAPKATLLDVALLQTDATGLTAQLGDAVLAFEHLLDVMVDEGVARKRSLVVNNSWAVHDLSDDFPPDDPGNYSDNPNHPFNLMVAQLEQAGADIVFGAGNCGPVCPDGHCNDPHGANPPLNEQPISGANSHPQVLTVGAVDVNGLAAGYSSVGPGRLTEKKPDLCGYTHFKGSGATATTDSGTSAAAAVVSGIVAAIRSVASYNADDPQTWPEAIRTSLTDTAADRGTGGFDYQYGSGIIDPCRLVGSSLGQQILQGALPGSTGAGTAGAACCCPGVGQSLSTVGLQSIGLQSIGLQSIAHLHRLACCVCTGTAGAEAGTAGVDTAGLQSIGLQSIGLRPAGLQSIGLQSIGLQSIGLQSIGLQSIAALHALICCRCAGSAASEQAT